MAVREYRVSVEIAQAESSQHHFHGQPVGSSEGASKRAQRTLRRMKPLYPKVATHVWRLERTFR